MEQWRLPSRNTLPFQKQSVKKYDLLPPIPYQRIIVKNGVGVAEVGDEEVVVVDVDVAVPVEVTGNGNQLCNIYYFEPFAIRIICHGHPLICGRIFQFIYTAFNRSLEVIRFSVGTIMKCIPITPSFAN